MGQADYYKPETRLIEVVDKLDGSITELGNIVTALGGTLIIDTPDAGNLLDKLDELDGTMDGKLDLTDLNDSDLKTIMDALKEHYDTGVVKNSYDALVESIEKLTDVNTNLANTISELELQTFYLSKMPAKITGTYTAPDHWVAHKFIDDWSGRKAAHLIFPSGQASYIYIGYDNTVTDTIYEWKIGAGEDIYDHSVGELWAYASNGNTLDWEYW